MRVIVVGFEGEHRGFIGLKEGRVVADDPNLQELLEGLYVPDYDLNPISITEGEKFLPALPFALHGSYSRAVLDEED